MSNELLILLGAAASIGFLHTLLGPDHYLPFIAMAKSGQWSLRKTSLVTLLCGTGHLLSSVLLGLLGITFGLAVSKLEVFDSFRGDLAAWGLLAFGMVYFIWGIKKALKNKPHDHDHSHSYGNNHTHSHVHTSEHLHVHADTRKKNITPWILFVIFFLGPCEPLIPLLMYPAAKNSLFALSLVTATFGIATILTMLGIVLTSIYSINFIPSIKFERYTHAIAGAIISFSGISIIFLGL